MDFISLSAMTALVQVILVDLVLAGDNAIVVAMAVAALPARQRAQAMFAGIAAATFLRIAFSAVVVQLLQIVGLLLAGGLLLVWVCWKLWRELRAESRRRAAQRSAAGEGVLEAGDAKAHSEAPKSLREAIVQIVIADVSMSLDNVLAVAGAAREHTWVLVVGLALSVAFMGLSAVLIARLLTKHHWIGYVGLAVIVYVAGSMIWEGAFEVLEAANGEPG
jgi:YjbE family integral membrane protein